MSPAPLPRVGLLFNYDYDEAGYARQAAHCRFDRSGFDLFRFPSNARLAWLDLQRYAALQARRGRRRGWAGVSSQNEHFGALIAALVAERLGLPGTPVQAILACQHKLHARRVLQAVAPEAALPAWELPVGYGEDIPAGLPYPLYVKPVRAAFSVLARRVDHQAQLQAHTRFGRRELWVIRHLVEPFDRLVRQRLPAAGSCHRMMLEPPVTAAQYNLDGWVWQGQAHLLGVVDALMYPGTQAFMRWRLPGRLPQAVQARALDIAQRFLQAVGFSQGLFNMEFFHDPASDRITVIEFNPRLASQFSDLYLRTTGVDPHAMAVALALGRDPAEVARQPAQAGAAASLVYRAFDAGQVPPAPGLAQRRALAEAFPDALLHTFFKHGPALQRELKWLGSHRYATLHLQGRDEADLRQRAEAASRLLGWPAPYLDESPQPTPPAWADASLAAPALSPSLRTP
jgi:biotin carboxylase